MRIDKKEAFKLRRGGRSYKEISERLNIPKSTLSGWLRDVTWSRKIKKTLSEKAKEQNKIRIRKLNNIRGKNLERLYLKAEKEAKDEFKFFKLFPLFILGLSIYWGEGDRRSKNLVRVSNTDPLMIKLFLKFLTEVCGVKQEQVYASILLYPDLDEQKCKKFWIKNAGLLEENFNKSILIKGKHKTNRLRYGVCTVGISSTYLKRKIGIWLVLLPKEFTKGKQDLLAGVV